MTAIINKTLGTQKLRLCIVVMMMFLPLCFHYISAEGYDANKLATLAKQKYGDEAHDDFVELQQLITTLRNASDAEKLSQINNFFNQKVTFADDSHVWGQSDYWATPLELLGLHAGDCEDFSIAKYVFLKAANIPNDKLRLTYVRAELSENNRKVIKAHMVLSYYATPQSEPLILDNLVPNISAASSRKDLSPIFSFNDKGLWVGNSTKPKSDSQSNLSRWRDVLARMRADGIE
ncbi:transglutaminase-like cysteine peptidase [Methylotenera sp. L2L1]|uniref:transglutaminase-like cysteine peptidase n=1 Tax=Methylotenera sp. L2L1 TaxID=1502770 RepID=UPI00068A0C45|nr:transglutaminase-like cysteine peptidase [Methylotenera sp. L2L1]